MFAFSTLCGCAFIIDTYRCDVIASSVAVVRSCVNSRPNLLSPSHLDILCVLNFITCKMLLQMTQWILPMNRVRRFPQNIIFFIFWHRVFQNQRFKSLFSKFSSGTNYVLHFKTNYFCKKCFQYLLAFLNGDANIL